MDDKSQAECPRYHNDDITRIGASYCLTKEAGLPVWPIWFKERLERIAWIYTQAKAEKKLSTPSTTKRDAEALRTQTRRLAASLEKAREDDRLKQEISVAAKELAGIYGLPDFEPEAITYESIPPGDPITRKSWPVDRQMQQAGRTIDWLVAVFDTVLCRMTEEMGHPGNRADEDLHEFIRAIDSLYRETAADPRNPYFDPISGVEKGELLGLLHACLYPLGIYLEGSALLGRWQRATQERA